MKSSPAKRNIYRPSLFFGPRSTMKPIAHILMAMMLLTCNKLHGEMFGVVFLTSKTHCLHHALPPHEGHQPHLHLSY